MKSVLVPLAEGFEETEAVTIIDILRRGNVRVIQAGLSGTRVTGAHGITVECDVTLDSVDRKKLDGLVLPGGQPGTANLRKSSLLRDIIIELDRQELLVAALCAAPTVLDAAGILNGKKVTSYPSCEKELTSGTYLTDAVVVDGNIITSRALGTALAFSLAVLKKLSNAETAEKVRAAVLG